MLALVVPVLKVPVLVISALVVVEAMVILQPCCSAPEPSLHSPTIR